MDCCLQVPGKAAPATRVVPVAPLCSLDLLRTKERQLLLLRGEEREGPSSKIGRARGVLSAQHDACYKVLLLLLLSFYHHLHFTDKESEP